MGELSGIEPRLEGKIRLRDGVRLAFSMYGSGRHSRKVALIHSLALDRDVWGLVVPQLLDHADVLTYDCRGHGHSETGTTDFTTTQFADDLAELFDAIGWSRALLAGCSMGGAIAQQFAASHQERVSGSVFVDTTAWYGSQAPTTWRERAENARRQGLAELLPFQLARWFSDGYAESSPAVVENLTSTFLANDLDAYEASCRMLGDSDLRPLSSRIRPPVAVVVGSEDYATPQDMARELAEATDAPLTVLSGAKHLTPLERPGEITKVVVDTLQRGE